MHVFLIQFNFDTESTHTRVLNHLNEAVFIHDFSMVRIDNYSPKYLANVYVEDHESAVNICKSLRQRFGATISSITCSEAEVF